MSMYLIPFGINNMGVKWWFFCILHQTIITTSSVTVKLPCTDGEALPIPKISSSLPTENESPQLPSPINPKLRKALLEYFELKYLGTNRQSLNTDECSSPAVVSSSSRVLPVSKIETQTVDDLVNIIQKNSVLLPISPYTPDSLIKPNTYAETLIPLNNRVIFTSVPTVQSIYERVIPNEVPLPSITSLPLISLESLTSNIDTSVGAAYSSNLNPPSDNEMYFGGYPTNNPLYNLPYPLRYNRLSLPDVITPTDLILSNLNPINNVEDLRSISPKTLKIINSYPNAPTSTIGLYALNLTPQISALNNEISNSFITQRVPKVPLLVPNSPNQFLEREQYNYLNQQKRGRKIDPLYDQALLDTLLPLPYLRNCDISCLSGFNLGNSCYPTISPYGIFWTLPEPIIPEANHYGLKMPDFKHETLPSLPNELNANINNMNNDFFDDSQPTIDIIIDTTIHCNIPENIEDYITGIISDLDVPEISKEIPNSISFQVTPHENNVDISSLALPIDLSFLNSNKNVEPPVLYENSKSDVCSLTTINYPPKLPQSAFPAIYINTSPTYSLSQISANAVSSLNDVVSSLTRTILNSYISFLTSSQSKDKNTACPIPYTKSSLGFYNTNLMKPCVPQYLYTTIFSPLNTDSTTTFLPLEPPFYDKIPSTTTNTYSNGVTATTSVTSSPPLKVTLLPPTSFLDYLPSQPCPSTLPLPTIPSYLDIYSPFTSKPQVLNVKPTEKCDRRAKTVERLLDLVLLAELLHGEGYIDWDALDTVLAILYAS